MFYLDKLINHGDKKAKKAIAFVACFLSPWPFLNRVGGGLLGDATY